MMKKLGRKAACTALVAVLAGCAALTKGYYVRHDGSLGVDESAFIASGLYRDGYIREPREGEPPGANVGVWPVVQLKELDGEPNSLPAEVAPGKRDLKVQCYYPYKTAFRTVKISIPVRPGFRYELASADKSCVAIDVFEIRRAPDDQPDKPVGRTYTRKLTASPATDYAALDEGTIAAQNAASAERSAERQRRAEIKGEQYAKEILTRGVGTKICKFSQVSGLIRGSQYGYVERIENSRIKILLPNQSVFWDEPQNWAPC